MIKKVTIWSEPERAAWALPEEMTVSQWADRYRVLDDSSAEPGQWRTDRVPYLRGIMDAFTDPAIETIALHTSTQIGKSKSIENCIGYIVDQDPGPALYVLPTKEDSEDVALHSIKPFVFSNDVMVKHLTGDGDDITKKKFVFDRMILYITGAGSPSALARRSIRYLLMDEVNKFPPFSGREADPLKLAGERQRAYWNRKTIMASTPTTPEGYITKVYEKSDERQYYVPCPHCGHFQTLKFRPGLVFPKDVRDPAEIKMNRLAWYECEKCREKIYDKHKHGMLLKGKWLCKGQKIDNEGKITGTRKMTDIAGFKINALYSPFLTFSEIAAEWLSCQGDVSAMMNFINSWLAETFQEKIQEITARILDKNVSVYQRGFVPDQCLVLTAAVDVQRDHFIFTIRGWGYGEQSWLIREGRVETWDQVTQVMFATKYFRADKTRFLTPRIVLIDSGDGERTAEVYDYCRRRPETRAVKGNQHLKAPWYGSKIDSHPVKGGKIAKGLTLWHIDVSYFKEKVHRMINIPQGEVGCWHLHSEVTDDYKEQICSEVKSTFVDKRTRRRREEWRLRSSGGVNHYLDCEVYATAGADMLGIRFMSKEDADKLLAVTTNGQPQEQEENRDHGNWITSWR